jgi:uncharacterized protein
VRRSTGTSRGDGLLGSRLRAGHHRAWQRDYAIADGGFDDLLSQFRALAQDYLEASLENRHHGFSNVRETLQEIHQGHARRTPAAPASG